MDESSRNEDAGGREWRLRPATEDDVPALEALIPVSVLALQAHCYTRAQMEAAIGSVFGVDRQLIRDGTYFVAEHGSEVIGCGGWSRRASLCGGDRGRCGEDPELDPRADPARIRAFFVHPGWARRGIGRALMAACERAISGAGFHRVVIMSTLAGEPLYAAFGYRVSERCEVEMAGGLKLPILRMEKGRLGAAETPQHPEANPD